MQLKRDGIVTLDQENLGSFANRLNNRIRDLKGRSIADAWSGEIRELLERVIREMEKHLQNLSATNCSRLAWLYLNRACRQHIDPRFRRGVKASL